MQFQGETLLHACVACGKAWEPLPADARVEPDEPYFAFDTMCDNCAFRKGSAERQNETEWAALQTKLFGEGGMFYCHKGVPFSISNSIQTLFQFPKKPDGSLDTDKMRLCRGYLNFLAKQVMEKQP